MLQLSLLGGFEVRSGQGEVIALPTRKARALLAYLALHPDQAVSRQSLTALLWSDRAEPQANNSLSQAVSAIRKALADVEPTPLVVEPESLKFVGTAAEVDVLVFEDVAQSADPATWAGPKACIGANSSKGAGRGIRFSRNGWRSSGGVSMRSRSGR